MLINAILVIKNSSSSSFPLLSCFFPPNTRFSLLKTLFCPSKLNTSHLHGKKIFKLHCQVCKNKRAFFRRKTLSLHKIGCGSAIEVNFIALTLHNFCKIIRQNGLRFGKIRHFPHGFSTDNARAEKPSKKPHNIASKKLTPTACNTKHYIQSDSGGVILKEQN